MGLLCCSLDGYFEFQCPKNCYINPKIGNLLHEIFSRETVCEILGEHFVIDTSQ